MSIYVKIDNLKFKGSVCCYYKEYIDTNLHQATIFNENYMYYYKDKDTDFKLLGKFNGYSKVALGSINCDIDFDVFVFQTNTIFTDQINNIYCTGISHAEELDEKMIETNLTYNDRPVYYKTN